MLHGISHTTWGIFGYIVYLIQHEVPQATWDIPYNMRYFRLHWIFHTIWGISGNIGYPILHYISQATWDIPYCLRYLWLPGYPILNLVFQATWDISYHIMYVRLHGIYQTYLRLHGIVNSKWGISVYMGYPTLHEVSQKTQTQSRRCLTVDSDWSDSAVQVWPRPGKLVNNKVFQIFLLEPGDTSGFNFIRYNAFAIM